VGADARAPISDSSIAEIRSPCEGLGSSAVAAPWLLRYLEEHPEATIDEAALDASCLAAL
jgi:hypothetical protein